MCTPWSLVTGPFPGGRYPQSCHWSCPIPGSRGGKGYPQLVYHYPWAGHGYTITLPLAITEVPPSLEREIPLSPSLWSSPLIQDNGTLNLLPHLDHSTMQEGCYYVKLSLRMSRAASHSSMHSTHSTFPLNFD